MLVWIIEGPSAGQFVPMPDEEAQKLIDEGKAQSPLTPAHLMKKPIYETREMVAQPATTAIPAGAVLEKEKKTVRRRAPKKKGESKCDSET